MGVWRFKLVFSNCPPGVFAFFYLNRKIFGFAEFHLVRILNLHKVVINCEFGDYGCNCGVQFSVCLWIKICQNVNSKPFSFTILCAGRRHPRDTALGATVSYTYKDTGKFYLRLIGMAAGCRDTFNLGVVSARLLGTN